VRRTNHSSLPLSPSSINTRFIMQVASPHPPLPPFHFFPKSTSPPSQHPSVVVKTRVITVPQQSARSTPRPVDDLYQRNSSQAAASANGLTTHPATKRHHPYPHSQRRAKRARSSDSSDATPPPPSSRSRESSIASSASSSRASTRNRSSPPTSVAPSTRSRSRSSSVLPIITDEPIPRECHIDEDAVLDDSLLSSENVVLSLMKSYVQCQSPLFASTYVGHHYFLLDFKNPNDPYDKSFDPHPTDYPVGELEFPNSGATERYVFFCWPRTSMASSNALCPFLVRVTAHSPLKSSLPVFCLFENAIGHATFV
jgi:[histone H3]-lysine79 N-trimethyltransferase